MSKFTLTWGSNEKLIDFLAAQGYVRLKRIEQVLKSVDLGAYLLPAEGKNYVYKDFAWKHGRLHLSAPCIYAVVLEALELEPGMSFLNLGSGIGYFSTVAGLLLSQHGTNHGIELSEECFNYAHKCLEKFKQQSLALDCFDFCEPVFAQGNCLNLVPHRQYDRVYCGAMCPEGYLNFIQKFVKPDGILVVPYEDYLIQFTRKSSWHIKHLLDVSFEELVVPKPEEQVICHLPDYNPFSLQELCRGKIRNCLRQKIWQTHTDIETEKPIDILQWYRKGPLLNFFYSIYQLCLDGSSDSQSEDRVSETGNCADTEVIPDQDINSIRIDKGSSTDPAQSDSIAKEEITAGTSMNFTCDISQEDSPNGKKKVIGKMRSLKKAYSDIGYTSSDSDTENGEPCIQRQRLTCPAKTETAKDDSFCTGEESSSSISTNLNDLMPNPPSKSIYNSVHIHYDIFTAYMQKYISQLPLHRPLKLYLNYDREL